MEIVKDEKMEVERWMWCKCEWLKDEKWKKWRMKRWRLRVDESWKIKWRWKDGGWEKNESWKIKKRRMTYEYGRIFKLFDWKWKMKCWGDDRWNIKRWKIRDGWYNKWKMKWWRDDRWNMKRLKIKDKWYKKWKMERRRMGDEWKKFISHCIIVPL